MTALRHTLRRPLRWFHLWMGLVTGLFICLMGVTGTIVTFRQQIANFLSKPALSANGCKETADWNQAEQKIENYAGSKINRIYFPADGDPRVHFRMEGESEKVYNHVSYDGCAAQVLGSENLGWMYWTVDLHHNLLAERNGRTAAGFIGLFLLASSVGGLLLWLFAKPNLATAFRIQTGRSGVRTSLDLHRAFGLAAMPLLILPAFTALWLCFPQPMRALLSPFAAIVQDTRPKGRPKAEAATTRAGLGDVIQAARQALPDGSIREIRLPEGNGNFQVRMWREGDFRSLGNNVVFVDSASARVLATDLYSAKPAGNRIVQAMAGLHYGEWGGLAFRALYGIAGTATVLLFFTGVLIWWLPKTRKAAASARIERKPLREDAPVAQ